MRITTRLTERKRRHLPAPIQKADLALFRRVASTDIPFLDRTLVPLTRAANNSRLWMVIALLLAASGGRFGKRAALRGITSLALTSFLANLPAKLIAHRHRPDHKVPAARRLRKLPASSSFPSGHSASAAAFAAGVSQEMPVMTLPLGTLAGAVGFSRVYTGVHYPLDVVAGVALGVATARATRKWWPVAPQEAASIREPRRVLPHQEGLVEGEGLSVVVNPSAGPAVTRNPTPAIKELLARAEVIEADDPETLAEAMERSLENAVALGICGGDGSINAGAEIALAKSKPFAVFPGGTLNHLARDLGISTIEEAAAAVTEGRLAAVDTARIDGRLFLNTASFGAYSELVDAREQLESKIGKWPAVFVALVKVLRRGTPVEVELNGVPRKIWMIFIGNCRYEPVGFAPSWRPRLDDGLLDIRIVDAAEPWARTKLMMSILTGRLADSKAYETLLVDKLTVESLQGPLRLARDGEVFDGSSRFVIEKDRPLSIYVLD